MNKQTNTKLKRLNATTRKVLAVVSVPTMISAYLIWVTGISIMLPILLIVPFMIIYMWLMQKTNIVICENDENTNEEQEVYNEEQEITLLCMSAMVTLTVIALLCLRFLDEPLCTGITGVAVSGVFLLVGWFLFHEYF